MIFSLSPSSFARLASEHGSEDKPGRGMSSEALAKEGSE